ncbi:TPA: putative Ig domain-containing protein [Burkholderia vietnamiensis]|nr:putative Ig domain-containing protein [Burkholderia vietnamiensis]
MKKTILAVLLSAIQAVALANQYYVVVPAPNKLPSAGNIMLSLSGYSLPAGMVGYAYAGFDFNAALQVLGDPSYRPADVRWSVVGGALPTGLSLSPDGKLTGTPTAAGTSSFQVLASYKTKAGEQSYQVVVTDLSVSLAAATPPTGVVGLAYSGFDLKPLVAVAGDAAYGGAGSGVTWCVVSGVLPAGLILDSTQGVISGTPTASESAPVNIQAAYKGKLASQSYTIPLKAALTQYPGYRGWSDGTYAPSCNAYRNPTGNYAYAGAIGDGVYRIKPGNSTVDVYCNQTVNGGGWTLVLTDNLPTFTNAAGEGTSTICTSVTGCNTGGVSNFYVGTPVESQIKDFLFTATKTGHPMDVVYELDNPANYIRGAVPAPGVSLFTLITDASLGWVPPAQVIPGTDTSDDNDPALQFPAATLAWTDGHWGGSGVGYQGMELLSGVGGQPLWGHHDFSPPVLNGSTYTIQPWTYYPLLGGPTTSTVTQSDAVNLYRWTTWVR